MEKGEVDQCSVDVDCVLGFGFWGQGRGFRDEVTFCSWATEKEEAQTDANRLCDSGGLPHKLEH